MKRRDWIKEKARRDFEDSLKEQCIVCKKWRMLNEWGECRDCQNIDEYPDLETT